jgi:hypothetical protein
MKNINDLTIGQLREIQALLPSNGNNNDSHWVIGKGYFLRTGTHHLTGVLVKVTPQELVLQDAAWIADDGRFAQAVASGIFAEVEPFPTGKEVIVGRNFLVDAVVIDTVPREQK